MKSLQPTRSGRYLNKVSAAGLLIWLLLGVSVFAVPEIVEEKFKERYPTATEVTWELDSKSNWEAHFLLEEREYKADFTETGEWLETETDVEFSDLPIDLQRAIREQYPGDEINEVEAVETPLRGKFYDVEFKRVGQNLDVEFLPTGEKANAPANPLEAAAGALMEPIPELRSGKVTPANEIGRLELLFEFTVNLIIIIIYAYVIYYRRHHDHKMMFLLLGFNLFLFPIFLLNSVLTIGFGFTIFALLALVRLRSDTFDKTEVAYLLGAVALTFINSVLPARVEYVASILVLLTAIVGDHPRMWRDANHYVRIQLPVEDTMNMLDHDHLRQRIEAEFNVEVNDIEIQRVTKKQVRLRVMYRDKPQKRKMKNKRKPAGATAKRNTQA